MLRRTVRVKNNPVGEIVTTERLKWRLRVGILMTMAVAMLLISPLIAMAGSQDSDFIAKENGLAHAKVIEPFALIELANGDEVAFTAIPNERGRIEGVMLTEKRSASRGSMREVEGLRDANPLEVFNALADVSRKTPQILLDLYGRDSNLGHQGWARDIVLTTNPANNPTCPAYGVSEWSDDMDHYADIFNDDDPFESTWDGPNAKPQHWSTIPGNGLGGLQNKELNGQANSVTAFFTSVLYCYEDYENAATFNGQYVGNYVQTFFRLAGHQNWIQSQSVQVDHIGDIVDHTYSPANRFSPGATKYDFHLTITQAKPDDLFHIGATWVYGGPSGVKLGS